jgi:hypothetical protein
MKYVVYADKGRVTGDTGPAGPSGAAGTPGGPPGDTGTKGDTGVGGLYGDLDGGSPSSTYGGIDPIDCGGIT